MEQTSLFIFTSKTIFWIVVYSVQDFSVHKLQFLSHINRCTKGNFSPIRKKQCMEQNVSLWISSDQCYIEGGYLLVLETEDTGLSAIHILPALPCLAARAGMEHKLQWTSGLMFKFKNKNWLCIPELKILNFSMTSFPHHSGHCHIYRVWW